MGSPLRHSGGNPFNCSSVETLVGKSSSDGVGDGADRGGTGDRTRFGEDIGCCLLVPALPPGGSRGDGGCGSGNDGPLPDRKSSGEVSVGAGFSGS